MFSFFRHSFRHWARSGTQKGTARIPRRPLHCESLEDRILPSLVTGDILVNTTKAGAETQPATATSSNGTSVIVWTEATSTDRDIIAQRFDANGNKVGGEIVVAGGRSPQHNAVVAMDAYGNFVVIWIQDWSATDSDIHGALFHANGSRNGSEFVVASTPNNEFDPSVGMAANGNFVVSYTYQFNSSDRDVKAVQYQANGTIVRTLDVAVSTAVEERSRVAVAADGRFAISYQSAGNIFVARYSAAGSRLGLQGVATSSAVEQNADLSFDGYGNVIVVWQQQNGSDWNIFGRMVSSTGTLGNMLSIASTSAVETLPSVAVDPSTGKIVVAYQTQSGSTTGVNIAELSAAHVVTGTFAVGTGLADPSVSIGGPAHRFEVVSQSIGSRGGDPDGGIFARFGIL